MDSRTGRQERPQKPTHPHLQAGLLMLGVLLFLVIAAVLEVR